jgi:hypothetical protein
LRFFSGPLLPVRRVAAGVKTGNHDKGLILNDKEKRVRKAAQESAARVFKDGGKLSGIAAHAFNRGINRLTKRRPSPAASPSYQSCASINSARGLSEDN